MTRPMTAFSSGRRQRGPRSTASFLQQRTPRQSDSRDLHVRVTPAPCLERQQRLRQLGVGLSLLRSDGPYIQNIDLEGNVAFNNYVWGVPWDEDILVGGLFPASGITINENYTYRTSYTNTSTADIGSYVVTDQDLVCTNNYFVGGWWRMGAWATATVTGNTLYNFTGGGIVWNLGTVSDQHWSDNTFFGDPTAVAWRHDSTDVTTFDGWRTMNGFAMKISPGRCRRHGDERSGRCTARPERGHG